MLVAPAGSQRPQHEAITLYLLPRGYLLDETHPCGLLHSDSSKPLPRTVHSGAPSLRSLRLDSKLGFRLHMGKEFLHRGFADVSTIGDLIIHWHLTTLLC